jgi:zinc protease
LPLDYLESWTDQIEQVSASQVREAFGRKVFPERLVTVIVGAGEAKP